MAASCGEVMIHAGRDISTLPIHNYWSSSKCRLERWSWVIKDFQLRVHHSPAYRRVWLWSIIEPVVEEIICAEVLTRVWTGVLYGVDRRHFPGEIEPIARSVLLGQMEARRRTLHLLVYGTSVRPRPSHRLNRLRRYCERWTDILLSFLWQHAPVCELAFEPDRTRLLSGDLHRSLRSRRNLQRGMLISTLAATLDRGMFRPAANPDLNAKIAQSVLGCLGPELFHESGQLKSLEYLRLGESRDEPASEYLTTLFGPPMLPPTLEQRRRRRGDIRGG
jgi:hypothetical protein